ncbi:hypothetical protein SLE2022_095170 [Rubroshorea leprosula]
MGSTRLLLLILVFMVIILGVNSKETAGQIASSPSDSAPGPNSINISGQRKESDNTVRVDPLNNFKKYRGGYDITNKHYWSSTVFTGSYGYIIGILWLMCGLVYGGYLVASTFCCKRTGKMKRKPHCFKECDFWPILLAVFFTILAITASGLVLGGSARFHSQAKTVVNIIIHTANEASETIYNTTGAMKEMRDNLGVTTAATPEASEASGFLTSTSKKLDVEAADIESEARKNRHLINKGLKIVYVITTLTVSLNLIAVIALSVTGILQFQRTLKVLIAVCWFLTVLCWLLSGMYFFLENFSSDTCTALESFQENPYNNSLSSILPCDELLSAKPVLSDVSAGIYKLVNRVNANISAMQATTYPGLAYVCNPFSAPPDYSYQPNNCPANSIKIGDIPKILGVFTCSDANNGTCKDGEFISGSDYRTVKAYTGTIQSLLNAYPGMENLVECQSVKDAFSEILHKHCKPMKKFLHMVWAAMVLLSIIMVFYIMIWATHTHYKQELHSSDGSVNPQSATANCNSV